MEKCPHGQHIVLYLGLVTELLRRRTEGLTVEKGDLIMVKGVLTMGKGDLIMGKEAGSPGVARKIRTEGGIGKGEYHLFSPDPSLLYKESKLCFGLKHT